jgi:hypothetical protein
MSIIFSSFTIKIIYTKLSRPKCPRNFNFQFLLSPVAGHSSVPYGVGVSSREDENLGDDTAHQCSNPTDGVSFSVIVSSSSLRQGKLAVGDANSDTSISETTTPLSPDGTRLTELMITVEAPLLPSEKSTVLPNDETMPPLLLIMPKLDVVLQHAKDNHQLLSKKVFLVNFFGSHLYELCPNPTPTLFDEYCRMIIEDHLEVGDRNFDVNIPSTKWVSHNSLIEMVFSVILVYMFLLIV